MTPEEAIEYVRETQRIADENHRRALALYDLVFPPWRWLKWWREYRAIRAAMHEVEVRNVISNGWLADGPTRERSDDVSEFRITRGEGFQIEFANGWTVSVQFGPYHYCSNRDTYHSRADLPDRDGDPITCPNAEVAAWDGNGKWIGDPEGWKTPNEVAAFIAEIAGKRKARKQAAA